MMDRRAASRGMGLLLGSGLLPPPRPTWANLPTATPMSTALPPLSWPQGLPAHLSAPLPPPLPDAGAQTARLVRALRGLRQGGRLKVAALGGSITTGHAAQPPETQGWAGQCAAWLQALATAHGGALTFLNLGVGGTDSACGVQRVGPQLLQAGVDLLLLEFGVNDEWLHPAVRARSYEGLLRQVLAAPQRPAVLCLHLTQQHGAGAGAVAQHRAIARHHGLPQVDLPAWVAARGLDWGTLYDEPVHPNAAGHAAIAQAVCSVLAAAAAQPGPVADEGAPVPPLHGQAFDTVRSFAQPQAVFATAPDAGPGLRLLRRTGFERGSPSHPDWARRPGGQPEGWTTQRDDGALDFLVRGRQILLFHAESDQFRNLVAWVDDLPPVLLRCHNPTRQSYLGWATTPVALDLEDDLHLLHVRVADDGWRGSGRSASLSAVFTADLAGQAPARWAQVDDATDGACPDLQALGTPAEGLRLHPADTPGALRVVSRPDPDLPGLPLLAWTHAQVRARFTGRHLGLRLQGLAGQSWFEVLIDGQRHRLNVPPGGPQDFVLRTPLAPGEHTLQLTKRSEALMTQARLHGLLLEPGAALLQPPPARALAIELYGDSISAGACNADLGADQYDDLVSHDGTRSYGALAARALDADYLAIAISGVGISASWDNAERMPALFDRCVPRVSAPQVPPHAPGQRRPDVVVVNLGQNDQGWPSHQGLPFPADYRPRYVQWVRALRQRYPEAALVCALGGMTGWKVSSALRQAWQQAVDELRATDPRLWALQFQACTDHHPRLDVHAKLADELTQFLRTTVLPQLPVRPAT
jgi:lysophospholipase L1-like esterase